MAYSLDHCVNANLLLCGENTNTWFDVFDDVVDEDDGDSKQHSRTREDESEPSFSLLLQRDEIVRTMVEREVEHLPKSDYLDRLRSGQLDLSLRREALDWIFKAHSHYSFGPMCICLATNYMDRFLSVYELPRDKAWTVQLLAVACFSLAAKMDETNVPQSVDLQVGDPKFVFEAKTIQRMELLVLSALKWRMQAFTAFSFIDHFLSKIIAKDRLLPSMSSIFRSVQLILVTIRGIDFLEFRPSEIAASVAILVSAEIEAADIDMAISSCIHVEKGRVLKCLELMKDLPLMSWCRTNGRSVSASPSLPQSPIGVLEAAILSSAVQTMDSNNNNNNSSITSGAMASIASSTSPDTKKKMKPDGFYPI